MTQNRTGFAEMGAMMGDLAPYQFVFDMLMSGIATATIVKVVAVDGNTVDVQPMVNQIDGAGTGIPHGTINNVPWMGIYGGGCAIIAPPATGDKGLCVFCHNDISSVKKTQEPANPGTFRRHSWSDGIYVGGLPMLNPAPAQSIIFSSTGVVITSPNVSTSNNFTAGNGVDGSFSTGAGDTVTVRGGIITNITSG